jgi:NAD(P)-dependent dehydrogenase (short-subunit alcohol dehydrogenase family)
MTDVEALARAVAEKHAKLDVVINNAGVYSAPDPVTQDGLDVRFAVGVDDARSKRLRCFAGRLLAQVPCSRVHPGQVSICCGA